LLVELISIGQLLALSPLIVLDKPRKVVGQSFIILERLKR